MQSLFLSPCNRRYHHVILSLERMSSTPPVPRSPTPSSLSRPRPPWAPYRWSIAPLREVSVGFGDEGIVQVVKDDIVGNIDVLGGQGGKEDAAAKAKVIGIGR
ncbi:hypothetical protein VNO78_11379 [Psophocarpus tetragonolobus]|uniref:Uncharacterized protein n=1 Tax=Psophocarpus tetragonolobus TaxID=3891 RepID=A0AAN9XNK2_PSOTE